ncbi:MAG: putative zinc-binding metallopeptidase [Geminicoccaceae bacterium]
MRLFACDYCGQLLYFENSACVRCGHAQGFDPSRLAMIALQPADGEVFQSVATPAQSYRYCANAGYAACNWLIPAEDDSAYCQACALNRTIPDLDADNNLDHWRKIELAKHRLVYALIRLRLPFPPKQNEDDTGLAFDFLADPDPSFREPPVLTGHAQGLITLNVKEADPVERERMRTMMAEPYRTLLGHLRHEIGHYYWERLIRDGGRLDDCRALFGDDSQSYGDALEDHYANGAPADWPAHFVSAYASAHPWEDWAESWAHYMHMVDTLETAFAYGLQTDPRVMPSNVYDVDDLRDPYQRNTFDDLVNDWLPLTIALNSLNRSMGHSDAYPFVLTDPIRTKLRFIHEVIHQGGY